MISSSKEELITRRLQNSPSRGWSTGPSSDQELTGDCDRPCWLDRSATKTGLAEFRKFVISLVTASTTDFTFLNHL
jgi:hypothetical protein